MEAEGQLRPEGQVTLEDVHTAVTQRAGVRILPVDGAGKALQRAL